MIFKDHCELRDRESVVALQEKLVTCLEALIAVRTSRSHTCTGSSRSGREQRQHHFCFEACILDEIKSRNVRDLLCYSRFKDGNAFVLFREMYIYRALCLY